MFHIIVSRYIKPPADLDAAMPEHQAYLDQCYRDGVFLLSGPRLPRNGGIILAQTPTREALIDVLERDPFRVRGLIEYDVMAWNLNRRAAALPEVTFPGSKAIDTPFEEGQS
jgi:uncharacterized protein YciI